MNSLFIPLSPKNCKRILSKLGKWEMWCTSCGHEAPRFFWMTTHRNHWPCETTWPLNLWRPLQLHDLKRPTMAIKTDTTSKTLMTNKFHRPLMTIWDHMTIKPSWPSQLSQQSEPQGANNGHQTFTTIKTSTIIKVFVTTKTSSVLQDLTTFMTNKSQRSITTTKPLRLLIFTSVLPKTTKRPSRPSKPSEVLWSQKKTFKRPSRPSWPNVKETKKRPSRPSRPQDLQKWINFCDCFWIKTQTKMSKSSKNCVYWFLQ